MNGIIKTFFVVLHHPTETTHYFIWKLPLYRQCFNHLSQIFLHHWTPSFPSMARCHSERSTVVIPIGEGLLGSLL